MDVAQPGGLHVEGVATGGAGLAEEHPLGAAVGEVHVGGHAVRAVEDSRGGAERDGPDVREVHVTVASCGHLPVSLHESHQAAAVDG